MKKRFCYALCLSLAVSSTLISAAAQTQPEPEILQAATPLSEAYSISIDGEPLDLGNSSVFISGGKLMIPVRTVAEKLGFSVSWNNDEKSVHLDNKTVNTNLYIGTDSYYMASSTAIGMSAPSPLGAAPVLVNDTTYAPAELFNVLYCADVVSAEDKAISINTKAKTEPAAQIPNPFTEHKTISEALDALSFETVVPSEISEGYLPDYIATLGDSLLQVSYKNGDSEIFYRTAAGTDDISGDYNTYEKTRTITQNGANIILKGSKEKCSLGIWSSKNTSYSLQCSPEITYEEMFLLIEHIKSLF